MNIFVAKLHSSVDSESLQALFEQFGEVESAKVIFDRETGNSKGFGFVEMPNESEALDAIENLNEGTYAGRELVVKKARPKEENGGGGGRYQRRY